MTVTTGTLEDDGVQASTYTVTTGALEVDSVGVTEAGEDKFVVRTPAAAAVEEDGMTAVMSVVGATAPSLALVSKKLAPGKDVVVGATGASEVVETTTGASVVAGTTTRVLDVELGSEDVVEETPEAAEATAPEESKLLEAVVEAPLLTSTLSIMTISPSTLVIFTSTVVVPNPLEFSKKLYVWRVVDCQVLPPSVLTSRLATALLALTTCIENQYAETPSLLWT